MLIIMIDFAAKSSKFLAKCQEKTRIFVSTRLFPLIFYQSPPPSTPININRGEHQTTLTSILYEISQI